MKNISCGILPFTKNGTFGHYRQQKTKKLGHISPYLGRSDVKPGQKSLLGRVDVLGRVKSPAMLWPRHSPSYSLPSPWGVLRPTTATLLVRRGFYALGQTARGMAAQPHTHGRRPIQVRVVHELHREFLAGPHIRPVLDRSRRLHIRRCRVRLCASLSPL